MTVRALTACIETLSKNQTLLRVLTRTAEIIPDYWYVIGGSLYQTVWNVHDEREPDCDIDDYDIVYFDPSTTEEEEREYERRITVCVPAAKIQVKNQALITDAWYKRRYHRPKDTSQYLSLEDAICKAYVSSPVIGVSWKRSELHVLEITGIDDLIELRVFPNLAFRSKDILPFYLKKVRKWRSTWPGVTFHDWDRRVVTGDTDT